MAVYSGKTGTIGTEAKAWAHMSSFTLSLSQDIDEIVSFGDRYKEKIPTILDWSVSADGAVDFAVAGGQAELYTAWEAGTELEIKLALDLTTYWVGKAFIESLDFTTAADGHAELSISLAGSKALILTKPVV